MNTLVNNIITIFNILLGLTLNFTHITGYFFGGISFLLSFYFFRKLKKEILIKFLGIFIIFGLIRAYFSAEQIVGFNAMLGYLIHWFLPFLVGYVLSDILAFKRSFWSYYVIFILILGFSILAYFGLFYKSFGPNFVLVDDGLLKGLNSHIGLASLCLMFSFFSLGQILFRNDLSASWKKSFVVLIFIFLVGVFLSGSRSYYISAILTYFMLGLIYAIKVKRINLFRISCFLIISACFLSLIYFFVPSLKSRIDNTNLQDNNVQERLTIYKVAISEIKARPLFGFGPGQGVRQKTFFEIVPENRKNVLNFLHLHSFYLNFAADFGLIGLGLFFTIVFVWLKRIWFVFSSTVNFHKAFAFGLLWAIVSILIGDTFDTFLRGPRIAMDLFWLTGLLLGNANETFMTASSQKER